MKVLLVTDQVVRIDNGKIYASRNYSTNFKRLSRFGELHLCAGKMNESNRSLHVYDDELNSCLRPENLTLINKSYIFPSPSVFKALKKAISKVDLVVGYLPSLNAEIAAFIARALGKKYMSMLVACTWDGLWNQDWKRKIVAPYRFLLNREVLRNSDYALYVTREFLQKRYPSKGLSAGISDVVLPPVDQDALTRRLKRINDISRPDVINLVTTASVNVRYKGQRFVLEALRILKDMGYENYRYYLIGGGSQASLHSLATHLGIADQVIFLGKVPHEKVFQVLDDMDIYVHPSLQEGLPRSMVEAMSRALPVIGSNTGAIPELIDNEYVVKRKSPEMIADALLHLRSIENLSNLARRNFNKAKEFQSSVLDSRRNEFYDTIISDMQPNL